MGNGRQSSWAARPGPGEGSLPQLWGSSPRAPEAPVDPPGSPVVLRMDPATLQGRGGRPPAFLMELAGRGMVCAAQQVSARAREWSRVLSEAGVWSGADDLSAPAPVLGAVAAAEELVEGRIPRVSGMEDSSHICFVGIGAGAGAGTEAGVGAEGVAGAGAGAATTARTAKVVSAGLGPGGRVRVSKDPALRLARGVAKSGVPRVSVVDGGFPALLEALKRRGWEGSEDSGYFFGAGESTGKDIRVGRGQCLAAEGGGGGSCVRDSFWVYASKKAVEMGMSVRSIETVAMSEIEVVSRVCAPLSRVNLKSVASCRVAISRASKRLELVGTMMSSTLPTFEIGMGVVHEKEAGVLVPLASGGVGLGLGGTGPGPVVRRAEGACSYRGEGRPGQGRAHEEAKEGKGGVVRAPLSTVYLLRNKGMEGQEGAPVAVQSRC
ncbi:unnamed protein product [Discosporangium mesarthrocarpum]